MMMPQFVSFDTPLGRCALVWGPGGILGVQLPEANVVELLGSIRNRFQDAKEALPPAHIADLAARIVRLLGEGKGSLDHVVLDFAGVSEFQRRVYRVAMKIPPGNTVTYGELARLSGCPSGARAVGMAMGKNPFPLVVPCHRVLAAGGKLGGFSAHGGIETKRRILEIESNACRAQGHFVF